MQRLLRKLLIFSIPFVLLLAFFFAFEPYDYFCTGKNVWYMSRSLSSMRQVLVKHPDSILLGDSRMANLNVDYINQVSGESWTSLAYGGATLRESIQQFWYATEHTTLKKVVIGFNFYTMNADLQSDRMNAVIEQAEHPLKFIGDYRYWVNAAGNAYYKWSNLWANWTGNERARVVFDDPSSMDFVDPVLPSERTEDGYRVDQYDYALNVNANCANYDSKGMDKYTKELIEIAAYCDANNIELTFVIAPSNWTIWEVVIFGNFFEVAIEYYKNQLKSVATVYDAEFLNDFAKDDANWLDGQHLVKAEKLHMARIIFGGEDSPYWLKTTPEQYNAGDYTLTDQMSIARPTYEV